MGGKSGESVVVGYRYFWDIQSGLGRGPVDEIVEIRVDDKTAYVGKPGEITQSKAIFIDKPNLFGGEDTGGEGGIKGRMEILMGEPDQKPSRMLVNLLKGIPNPKIGRLSLFSRKSSRYTNEEREAFISDAKIPEAELTDDDLIPGFRGIVTTVFSGLISCYNAYPKKHSYRVRRNKKGWYENSPWYPEKCRILLRNDNLRISGLSKEQEENVRQIHAMNPAHILVECATNKSWGGKKELSDLDLDSYKKAADTLYREGFGLCMRYNRHSSIKEFMQQVVEHIGAIQYDNVETGKQAIRLLRNDYDADKLPTFNYDNGILKIQDDDSSATDNAANQIILKFLDPVTNKEDQAIANNIASIRMHGVISKTVSYKGIPTFDLAARVAQRDLEMVSSSLTRLKIVFDMRASNFKPGDVFKVNLPDRNIESAVFRVSQIESGNENEFIVTCMMDVFGLPKANYSTKKSKSLYVPPNFSAEPINTNKLVELPYHVLPFIFNEAMLKVIKPTDCYITALAEAPTPLSLGFQMWTKVGENFRKAADMTFVPSVIFPEKIQPFETKIKFKGDGIELMNAIALMVNDEILRIDSVDLENETITVGRGCADTIPQAHEANARAWCYLFVYQIDPTTYAPGEKLQCKLLTKTSQELYPLAEATPQSITLRQRQARPYPPGNVKVDGVLGGQINDVNKFSISWAHRSKEIQSDKLISHMEDSVVTAPDGVYKIKFFEDNKLIRTVSTKEDHFIYPDTKRLPDETFNRITLGTWEDGLESLYEYEFTVSGAMTLLYDWNFKKNFTVGNQYLNKYDDTDMPGGKYIMLDSDLNTANNKDIYLSFPLKKAYKKVLLSYKVGSYGKRKGLCKIALQFYYQGKMVSEMLSATFGNWKRDEWHHQAMLSELNDNVDEVRFKIIVEGNIHNNALAFKDIVLKVNEA